MTETNDQNGSARPDAGFSREYHIPYDFADFPPGSLVLDVGCGKGAELQRLLAKDCKAVGVEISDSALSECRKQGLPVLKAAAEALPFRDDSIDGIINKGVITYTDDTGTLAETARVLKPGHEAEFMALGSGYFARLALQSSVMRRRLYGLAALVNTQLYSLAGRRTPRSVCDAVYHWPAKLLREYKRQGLELVRSSPSPTFLSRPVLIYHRIRKQEKVAH